MGFDQYHEPASELSQEIRTFAKMIASLIEEAEAINWYEQRISVEKNKQAKAIMANAQKEEFKHFGMNLEFLLQYKKDWRIELQGILFKEGDIVGRLVVELDGKEVASTDLLAGADVTRRSFFLTVWNFLRSLVKG